MKRALPLLLVCFGALAHAAPAPKEIDDDRRRELERDIRVIGTTPEELFIQVDSFFTNKQWLQCCARLDRLRELGQDLKKRSQKASYAYTRCAAIHLKVNKLKETDDALELSKTFGGEDEQRKPVEADLHRVLARMALEKDDLPTALAHYEIAAAKYPDSRKEQEASLALSKFALFAYNDGKEKDAREATTAALIYYPENRDAQRLDDSLAFWSNATPWLIAAGLFLVGLVLFVRFRKRPDPNAHYEPYDPYAS